MAAVDAIVPSAAHGARAVPCAVLPIITPLPASTVTVKLKLIGMELASDPDLLELVTRSNGEAERLAERYVQAGPFFCVDHPEGTPSIEVSAIFRSSVKVRQVKFCCAGLTQQVSARMAGIPR